MNYAERCPDGHISVAPIFAYVPVKKQLEQALIYTYLLVTLKP
jgi:hypothetical protein